MEIRPMSDHTGAEVRGIDLARPVDARGPGRPEPGLRRAQRPGDPRPVAQAAAGARGGRAVRRVFQQHNTRFALPECPQIHYLSNQDRFPDGRRYIPGEGWHTDHSNDTRPPKATVLHAVTLPDRGGDTQFANMHAAYDGAAAGDEGADRRSAGDPCLPEQPQRAKTDGAVGRRTRSACRTRFCIPSSAPTRRTAASRSTSTRSASKASSAWTTRRRLPLLDELLEHATAERFQYRHGWKPGDLVIWDNRCLLHKANGDYDMAADALSLSRHAAR